MTALSRTPTLIQMGWPKRMRTEHGGAKNSSAKNGWWGPRVEAKLFSCKRRRRDDDRAAVEELLLAEPRWPDISKRETRGGR